jgi:hypothetical protein
MADERVPEPLVRDFPGSGRARLGEEAAMADERVPEGGARLGEEAV